MKALLRKVKSKEEEGIKAQSSKLKPQRLASPTRLVFLGPPGSGKGTQAKRLAEEFGLKVIAAGDILREAIRAHTSLGKRIKSYVETGALVPDELMLELISEKIDNNASFILDGFPRTIEQAKGLEQIIVIDRVVYFKCDTEIVVKRLSNRRICPKCTRVYNLITNPPYNDEECDVCKTKLEQRKDDTEAVVRERIKVYETHTLPVLDFYRSRLLFIDGGKDIEDVHYELTTWLIKKE